MGMAAIAVIGLASRSRPRIASVIPDNDSEWSSDSRYTAMLLAQTREELDKADLKATAIFTVSSVLGTGLALTFPALESDFLVVSALAAAAVTVVGLASVALAVWPRTGSGGGPHERLDYFMDVVDAMAGAPTREAAWQALGNRLSQQAAVAFERDVRQLAVLSVAAARKYRHIQVGMALLALGVGGLLTIVSLDALALG